MRYPFRQLLRGDTWDLSWKDCKAELQKIGIFSMSEKFHFNRLQPYVPDAIGAISFSKEWAKAARKATDADKAPQAPA